MLRDGGGVRDDGWLHDGYLNSGSICGGDENPHTLHNRLLGNRETGVDGCGAGTLS